VWRACVLPGDRVWGQNRGRRGGLAGEGLGAGQVATAPAYGAAVGRAQGGGEERDEVESSLVNRVKFRA
jgi:hypothetical protein